MYGGLALTFLPLIYAGRGLVRWPHFLAARHGHDFAFSKALWDLDDRHGRAS